MSRTELHENVSVSQSRPCPSCHSETVQDFFESRSAPLCVGELAKSRDEALRAPLGDIVLVHCLACGFTFNRCFDSALVDFKPGYDASLVHSETFRSFLEDVANKLISEFGAERKNVIEIGCGKGFFLRLMCERGENDGVGIDPTVVEENVEIVGDQSIQWIRDFYTEKYESLEADFVHCLSVFEDIPEPLEFLRSVRRLLSGGRDPHVYFEVFNARRAFDALETWSVPYEQCNYFGLEDFKSLFSRAGFVVLEAEPCYAGNQYIHIVARPQTNDVVVPLRGGTTLDPVQPVLPPEIAGFADHYEQRLRVWQRRFEEFARDGRKVAMWGSGGKGITFLNALGARDKVEFVAEINPERQGKFIPGTGQKVVAPEALAVVQPDVVILTNPLYEAEIRQQAGELGLQCEFFVA